MVCQACGKEREDGARFCPHCGAQIAVAAVPQKPEGTDADLLLASLELTNRNPRYTVSDTLAALAAQPSEEARHATHAWLRLSDRQAEWEAGQLRALAHRMAAPVSRPAQPQGFRSWAPNRLQASMAGACCAINLRSVAGR